MTMLGESQRNVNNNVPMYPNARTIWETDNLCIKRDKNGVEIDRGVCVNEGTITFRVKKSTQAGMVSVSVDTVDKYYQGHATGSTSTDFNRHSGLNSPPLAA